MIIKRLLTSAILFFPLIMLAQSINLGTPFIKNFQKKDYQGGTQNWDVAQSKQGVIYFANNNGLLRYDGTEWNCTSLPNKTILRTIAIDDNGKIYAGGQGEIGYFLPDEKGLLTYFSLKELIPEAHRQFEDVWEIIFHQESIFFRASNKIFELKEDNSCHIYSNNNVLTFLGEANDELFVFSPPHGLKKFNGNEFIVVGESDLLDGIQMVDLIYRPNLGYLIATFKSGLFIYDGEKVTLWDNPLQEFFRQNRLNTLQTINGKKLAFGTMLGGVVVMDEVYRPIWKLNKKNGLSNNNILSLYEDIAGQLWLGYDNGIGYVQANKPLSYLTPDGELEGTAYTAAVFDNKLYLGTTSGLYVKDWQGYYNPFGSVDFQLVENTEGQVWGLSEVNGELFLGHNEGAFIVKGKKATKIHSEIGTWMFLPIHGNEQKVLAGTYYGFNLLEKKNGKWELSKRMEGFDESSRILAKSLSGDYWMAHPYRGVFKIRLDVVNDNIKSSTFYGKEKGLSSDILNNVFLIFNKILVTSESGIFYYDEGEDLFKTYDEFNSLFDDKEQVLRLFEDKKGNVWFVTSNEIGYLKVTDNGLKKEVEKIVIPELNGKLVGGFEYIFPHNENNVFIGTDKGFIHYNANQIDAHEIQKPQVILSQVDLLLLHNDSLLFQGTYSDGTEVVVEQPKASIPEFSNQENAIRFKFSATEFDNPELATYQHLLEGAEEEWSDWNSKTEKEYNNLKHGDYIFKLRTKKGDGTVSDEVHYRFSISPPWYATTLAFGIYSLLFAGLLLSLILVPRRQYKKETEQLKSEHQQVVEKTEQEIADLKNEKLQSEIDHQNQTLATTTMHLVQKKEMLSRMKDELKKIAKTKEHKERKEIERIIRMIEQDARLDDDWEQFSLYFDKVHSNFLKKLSSQYPNLTPKDKKLCAYLRMNLSTKEIAPLMNISVRGVEISRYRLRKKLELPSGGNLVGFLMDV